MIPRFSSVNAVIPWFKQRGLWCGQGYAPTPGDIIFIDWETDGTPDHVELVERVQGTTVYTIGGNRDGGKGACSQGAYHIYGNIIYGYATPKYSTLLWPTPDCKVVKKPYAPPYVHIGIGVEVGDPTGYKVIAAKTGTVASVKKARYGQTWEIRISHGDKGEMTTIYDRCINPLVQVGDEVAAGQQIASLFRAEGDDGVCFQFGVEVNGKPADPFRGEFLSKDGIHGVA